MVEKTLSIYSGWRNKMMNLFGHEAVVYWSRYFLSVYPSNAGVARNPSNPINV